MKKIYLLSASAICMLILGCNSYDDDVNGYIFLEIQDAFSFENSQEYVVGDTIYVELNFDRYLDENGFSNKLDIFESSGSELFWYDFAVNKFSELSERFNRVDISPEFLFAEKGTVGGFERATAQLNQDKTLYESRIGIILVETGRFEFDFEFLYIRSNNFFEDKVQIEIQHLFTGDPSIFEFNVTE